MERVSVQQIVWSHELITRCVDISDSSPESGMRWGWIQDQTGSISIMWRWSQPETTGSHSQQPGSAATATTTDQQQISLSSSVVVIKHLICLFFFVMIQLKNSLCLDNCCSHGPPLVWDQLPLFVSYRTWLRLRMLLIIVIWAEPANNDWDTAY